MQFLAWLAFASVSWASTIVQLNGTTYYSPDVPVGTVETKHASKVNTVIPVTYVNETPTSTRDLEKALAELMSGDDVISEAFISTLVFPASVRLPNEVKQYLGSLGINIFTSSSNNDLFSGPYFLQPSGSLTQVYKLYVDTNMAFTGGIIQNQRGGFLPSVAAAGESINAAISIPVPSRHYYPKPSAEKPLSGLRLGVKDIFDMKGLKTGGGSRAYFSLNAPADETASSLQRLIDMGAVVIGKLKTSQFATGEIPTANYVDQLAPFNPRGDGYQSPAASSCGNGAALASYDWLDLALGSDTTGSIRGPSAMNGVFGMRITNGSLPLDGMLPVSPVMDTPGLMARDAKLLQTANANWFRPQANYTSFPKQIILPTDLWAIVDATIMPKYDSFITSLATSIGAGVRHMNTTKSLIEKTGQGWDIFNQAAQAIQIKDQWDLLGQPLISDYQRQFGRTPYVDPVLRMGLDIAPNITSEDYVQARNLLTLYQEWFVSQLVPACESSLVMYPIDPGWVLYRDDSLRTFIVPEVTTYATQQAAWAGVPDYAVPIGAHTYISEVSMIEEEVPVAVGIVAGAGCDRMLMDLIVILGENNDTLKTVVKTGRTM